MVSPVSKLRRIGRASQADSGAILLLALLFLMLLGIVSATVVQTGTLQMRMSLNEQLQMEAHQDARALARAMLAIPGNFDSDQAVGSTRCVVEQVEQGCGLGGLQPPEYQPMTQDAKIEYRVMRQGPEFIENPPLLESQDGASVARVALFEVQVLLDGSDVGLGSAEAMLGVMLQLAEDIEQGSSPDSGSAEAGMLYAVYWRYPQTDPF